MNIPEENISHSEILGECDNYESVNNTKIYDIIEKSNKNCDEIASTEEKKERIQLGECQLKIKYEYPKKWTIKEGIIPYKPELLDDIDMLKKFIVLEYARADNDMKSYAVAMLDAIERNNIEALECLWQGIYWHDQDNAPYDKHVIYAFSCANVKTIKHCIYAFQNYIKYEGYYALSRPALLITAAQNNRSADLQNIKEYVRELPCYIHASINE